MSQVARTEPNIGSRVQQGFNRDWGQVTLQGSIQDSRGSHLQETMSTLRGYSIRIEPGFHIHHSHQGLQELRILG
jgi:hypothetical protein